MDVDLPVSRMGFTSMEEEGSRAESRSARRLLGGAVQGAPVPPALVRGPLSIAGGAMSWSGLSPPVR
ncbi:hypothetical protein BON30_04865 [Cystobacter ferrugineus]|uniref:Uncharacterized protein n=1 Tax=Cystobacter ferrugineus TaxID=83449 RepID=A0A1L9BJZ9_9BACT|nr:hypothetical protein BON30_04865 [Cystobacter ferrugineus]